MGSFELHRHHQHYKSHISIYSSYLLPIVYLFLQSDLIQLPLEVYFYLHRIAILVLQPERLVRDGDIRLAVESAPAVVVAELQQPADPVDHFKWNSDLVAVEVVLHFSVG